MAKLRHQAIGNYAWMVIIRRADLPQQVKTVAFVLATYADADGSNACVGKDRLADEAICDERYARDSLHVLLQLGLLEVTRYGRRDGDADTYQLTTPGRAFPAVPMRRDPEGRRIDAEGRRFVGKRVKPPAVRVLLALLSGNPLPVREMPIGDGTGNPLPEGPVDNSDPTGNPLPEPAVDNPGPEDPYRQRVAGTYRHWVPLVPALGATGTGNPLPPTNSYQLLPTNSPQATTSLGAVDNSSEQDREVEIDPSGEPDAIRIPSDAEFEAARDILAALAPRVVAQWRHRAETELDAAGTRLDKRTVTIHAADLATRPAKNGAA